MFLVSHFPHLPIATTNPATEGAAREQQLRQPLPAPEAMAKTAAERRLEPQHERPFVLRDGKQQRRRSQSEGEQTQDNEQHYGSDSLKSLLAQSNPTMDNASPQRHSDSVRELVAGQNLSSEQAQQFRQVIANIYGDSSGNSGRTARLQIST